MYKTLIILFPTESGYLLDITRMDLFQKADNHEISDGCKDTTRNGIVLFLQVFNFLDWLKSKKVL